MGVQSDSLGVMQRIVTQIDFDAELRQRGELRMLTAKEAVEIARKYMRDIYGALDGLNVEELELNDTKGFWSVTMGYWEFLPDPKPSANSISTVLGAGLERGKVRRAYKELRIAAASGDVLSMKIRPVPSAEPR